SDQMGVPVTTSPAPSTTSVTTTEELEDEDEQQQSAPIAAPAPAVPPPRVRGQAAVIAPSTCDKTRNRVSVAEQKEIEAALDKRYEHRALVRISFVMPTLVPRVATTQQALAYREIISAHVLENKRNPSGTRALRLPP
ncbi:hypothetical protein PR002_g32381, partial [Phytophthora rubi]